MHRIRLVWGAALWSGLDGGSRSKRSTFDREEAHRHFVVPVHHGLSSLRFASRPKRRVARNRRRRIIYRSPNLSLRFDQPLPRSFETQRRPCAKLGYFANESFDEEPFVEKSSSVTSGVLSKKGWSKRISHSKHQILLCCVINVILTLGSGCSCEYCFVAYLFRGARCCIGAEHHTLGHDNPGATEPYISSGNHRPSVPNNRHKF